MSVGGAIRAAVGAPDSASLKHLPMPEAMKELRTLMAVAQVLRDPVEMEQQLLRLSNAQTQAQSTIEEANRLIGALTTREAALTERQASIDREAQRRETNWTVREGQLAEAEAKKVREAAALKADRDRLTAEVATAKAEAEAIRDEYRRKLQALQQAA